MLLESILAAVLAFAAMFVALMLVEKLIHKLTHNPDKSYRWGVWVFSSLVGVWAFITSLGR
jgi:uncharacterized protein HemY